MDQYYIKERLMCTEEEKLACMPMVQWVIRGWEVGRRDGFLRLQEEVMDSAYYHEHILLQAAIPLFDINTDAQSMRRVLESYIILDDLRGKELLESLIILEGFCGITEKKLKGEILESICMYFGTAFRDRFYQYLRPAFLNEKFF